MSQTVDGHEETENGQRVLRGKREAKRQRIGKVIPRKLELDFMFYYFFVTPKCKNNNIKCKINNSM